MSVGRWALDVEWPDVESRSARSNLIGAVIASALVLFFSLILLWRDPLVFWNDDYQISILPVFADVARSWGDGHWPLLSPYSWVCGNLAGEFQYGTFSIFINAAVVIIWNIFAGFAHQAAALSIVHLVVLATGAFVLARSRGISVALAIMVSSIAALNGWIICWGASDWFGALGAFAWLPWAWWGLEKALGARSDMASAADATTNADHRRDADATHSRWRFLWPAPFVYLVATGGFPYTIVMLTVLIGWLAIRSIVQTKRVWAPVPMLIGAALGFGMSAPAIFALLAQVHGSAREAQPASAHWQWIVPPTALPGLILPNWTAKWADFSTRYVPHPATELTCGLVASAAVLSSLIFNPRPMLRRIGWDLALLGMVLTAAMLPTAGVFRWSFRWLPLFHLVLAVCAAECLTLLGARRLIAAMAVFLTVGLAALMKLLHAGGNYASPLTWVLIVISALWAFLELALTHGEASVFHDKTAASSHVLRSINVARHDQFGAAEWMPAAVTFASLLATYLCIPPNCGVPRYHFSESLIRPEPLDPARLYLSVYPAAELAYPIEAHPAPVGQIVRPGSTSMWARLHFVNGYSPIRPSGIARQWFFSIHGEVDSGTARWLLSQEAGAGGGLAELGVDGIVMATEMDFRPEPADEWELAFSSDEGRVFHRHGGPLDRVRSVRSIGSRSGMTFARATISGVQDFRNSVAANVDVPSGGAPALITFCRPYFEGYRASLGGKSLEVRSERGVYPTVELPAGSRGRLVLRYHPAWIIYGATFALVCASIWITSIIIAAARRTQVV